MAIALSKEDGKDVAIFITPPDENGDTDEDAAGEEEANPGIVHFFRNMLEAEAEIIVVNGADNDTLNKKQKHKKKKQYKCRKEDVEKTQMITQKMII